LFTLLKKNLDRIGVTLPKRIEERFIEINVDKTAENLFDMIIWEPVGSQGVRAMVDALKDGPYEHLRQFRLWKAD
jgi:hypothetical protein